MSISTFVSNADKKSGVVAYAGRVGNCPITGKQTNCFFRSESGRMILAYGQQSADAADAATGATPGYQPKTGQPCACKPGVYRDNCSTCEGTGFVIDFAAIRAATAHYRQPEVNGLTLDGATRKEGGA